MARPLFELDPEALHVPWLESPFSETLLEAAGLSPDVQAQCQAYSQRGYVVVDLELSGSVIDAILDGLDGRYRPGGAPVHAAPDRIQDAWAIDDARLREAVLEVACHRPILDLLRVLYRREPVPFQTLNFARGTQQRAHSDTVHFHCVPARFMCGVWVALEDIHPDAGPLHYYPGSHRLPLFTPSDLGFATSVPGTFSRRGDVMREYEHFVQALVRAQGLRREILRARRGQALVWAANLLHGGEPIRDVRLSRHSMVTHYFFEGCLYYTPFDSDVALGRYALREPLDLTTGALAEQRYAGMPTRALEHGPIRVHTPVGASPSPRLVLRTERPLRILAWPHYESDADLRALVELLEGVVADREDVCLCLRFDPSRDASGLDRGLDQAVERVRDAIAEACKDDGARCEVLVVDDAVPDEWLDDLHGQISAVLQLPGTDPERRDLLARVRRPVLQSASELERVLLGA